MPVCCRCNASGRCRNCLCRKSGRPCGNCLPHRHGRCQNSSTSPLAVSAELQINMESQDAPPSSRRDSATAPMPVHDDRSSCCPPHHEGPSTELESGISDPHRHVHDYPLPSFSHVHEPTFTWGNQDGSSFADSVTCCYAEVVRWKRNLFKVPSGKAGASFVKELTCLFKAYTEASALESVALKAVMILPHLLLQKSHRTRQKITLLN